MFKIQSYSEFNEKQGRPAWVDIGHIGFTTEELASQFIQRCLVEQQQWVNDKFRVVPA